jgi:hypothetical protein
MTAAGALIGGRFRPDRFTGALNLSSADGDLTAPPACWSRYFVLAVVVPQA